MKYIYITKDAIDYFVSNRLYLSFEYDFGEMLYNLLSGHNYSWQDNQVFIHQTQDGVILYTPDIDKNNGVLFDLTQFDAFSRQNESKVITIFQKTLKYAVRYFGNLSLAPCERNIENTNTTIVYPFPFTANKNVYKILIDKNGSKIDRKGKNILTVFASGENIDNAIVSYTVLHKAVAELPNVAIERQKIDNIQVKTYCTTTLDDINFRIGEGLNYNNWEPYLTKTQKSFIYNDVNGAERLEGAAGTGKTLSMILRCIFLLNKHPQHRIIFVTHSKATRNHIIQIFKSIWPEVDDVLCTHEDITKSLLITTLQEWCIQFLGTNLPDTEYIDKDAQDSKIIQSLYIEQAFDKVMQKDFDTYKKICSNKFVDYIQKHDKNFLIELIQYEIATIIKGRSEGDIDKYKKIDRSNYLIPCDNINDRCFLYIIFQEYQKSLEEIGKYDSDDIILTALGQLDTPIWKRRRNKEGFNICFIDETHLFNLNELSIFHYLNCDTAKNNIVFAIDKSQYIGERGILDSTMMDILKIKDSKVVDEKYDIVFRSSPDIINLAYNVLSSAACVFQHFENPLISSSIVMSGREELKCISPKYYLFSKDEEMIIKSFEEVDLYSRKNNISRSKILITTTSQDLFKEVEQYAKRTNKPISVIKSRGDAASIENAFNQNQYVIGDIDFIGGLEFDYVIIVGVDGNRVPPKENGEASHFITYSWHNRLYVAITRAKYAILLLGNQSNGISPILESAVYLNLLEMNN